MREGAAVHDTFLLFMSFQDDSRRTIEFHPSAHTSYTKEALDGLFVLLRDLPRSGYMSLLQKRVAAPTSSPYFIGSKQF